MAFDLNALAVRAMRDHGFEPDFPPDVQAQLADLAKHPPAVSPSGTLRDLRNLLWSSIDNDTSRDLDQAEVVIPGPNGTNRVLIAIADVDAFAGKQTPIDRHAASETTTVYTGVRMFPMLPEALSTGATSLLESGDKLSVVTEVVVGADNLVQSGQVYRAVIRNKAQLAYNGVGAWLEGRGPAPAKVAASADLQAQLKLQDRIAQGLKAERFRHGALNIETLEVRAVVTNGQVTGVENEQTNRATELIENFMIAANEAVARQLDRAKRSSIRRVVRTPKRWDRIVQLASGMGTHLPAAPDSKALNDFLCSRKTADPEHFADLSLAVLKLMGPGEYVLERAGDPAIGHFGLAVEDYTHSTAPNRRFADLVTQRMLKAVDAGQPSPYTDDELRAIADACTRKADEARKVEREMTKRISAMTMMHRIGEMFDAIVTGVSPKGTFVRVLTPHIEGMLVHGQQGVDVGDKIRVKLVRADVNSGYIDFARG